ncbi:helix-turn-helix domain-containing protein [Rhodobacterales bacterium HKCCSP123]|nr:helix-turn-helix domain-containing protein [Rhodobacterales bacterium HKCCSP123]
MCDGRSNITGHDLKKLRQKAGLTQAELASQAGVSRHAVIYWEKKAWLKPRAAVLRMSAVLEFATDEWMKPQRQRDSWLDEFTERRLAAEMARIAAKRREQALGRCVRCCAKTRRGTSCRRLSEPGRRRCKFHGGLSTGPKSPEGKARIAAANRRRWAERRNDQASQAKG